MIGVTGRVQDFSGNSDLAEELAALREGDDNIALACNINVVVPGLCPRLHDWDGVHLDIEYEERNAFPFQFLGKTRMVNVIVRGECVPDLVQGHAHSLEVRLHGSKGAGPADIDKQTRSARTDDPVVGRAVADIHNCHRRHFDHGSYSLA